MGRVETNGKKDLPRTGDTFSVRYYCNPVTCGNEVTLNQTLRNNAPLIVEIKEFQCLVCGMQMASDPVIKQEASSIILPTSMQPGVRPS